MAISPYEVGRPIEDVARVLGLDPASIVKLTANESPDGPFPGVIEAVTEALVRSNRYPDNAAWDLSHTLAGELGVGRDNLLLGNGSTALISDTVRAVSELGANIIYGWPSFVMYRFAAIWAGIDFAEVPLTTQHVLDLDAMIEAVDADTRCVILCNPNNPTGTITPAHDVESFIDHVSDDVLVLVDEAYHEFVQDDRYRTAIPLALSRENVIVLRTFSKIHSLAAFRVGYAVGHRDTLYQIQKAQQPLAVTTASQVAALASLGQPDEVRRRVETNAAARHHLSGVIAERGLLQVESQTNFIFFKMPGEDSAAATGEFTSRGVILRPINGGWLRVTIGSSQENERFVTVLDDVLAVMA